MRNAPIVRRATFTVLTAGLALGVATPVASADTPGCVSAYEYNRVYAGQTPGSVKNLFDTGGFEKGRYVQFQYDGFSDYDADGNLVGYQPEYYDEETGEYYAEQGGYARLVDHVRSYYKCYSFDHRRGRVGVLFDTYTYGSNGAFAIDRYHPSYLEWWKIFEGARGTGKPKSNLD